MKWISFILCIVLSSGIIAQNHSKKPIRFIFESIHDHLGNLEMNSKKVQLFSPNHDLLYEADLYDGKELDEQFFYYTADGKLLRDHRIFHQEHESGDFRMTYDDKGNLIQETNYNDIAQVLERITMTYDADGNMITEKKEFLHSYEGVMKIESNFTFTYENGKIATKKGYEDEKEDQIITYKYKHEAGSETISRYNSSDVILEKWISKFDEKGRLLSKIHSVYSGGTVITKTIDFTYDEYDHILTEVLSKSNSSVKKQIIFEYKYDEYGNWTERTEKKIMGVRETEGVSLKRVIEYYEHDEYEHPAMELDESFDWIKLGGKDVKSIQETHVRINNNEGQIEWVVRRDGQTLYQVDEYEYKDGKLDRVNHLNNSKKENAYTVAKYNEKGLTSEIVSYSYDGKVDERTTFKYDDKGILIRKEEQFTGKSHGPLKTTLVEEYKYDGSGKLIKTDLAEYGSSYEIEYEYDEAGNLVKEIQSPDSKDEEIYTTAYTYEKGKLVSKIVYEGKSDDHYGKDTYEYDNKGELIRSAHYKDGTLSSEIDYVYFG